jgi:hypothetical protein
MIVSKRLRLRLATAAAISLGAVFALAPTAANASTITTGFSCSAGRSTCTYTDHIPRTATVTISWSGNSTHTPMTAGIRWKSQFGSECEDTSSGASYSFRCPGVLAGIATIFINPEGHAVHIQDSYTT